MTIGNVAAGTIFTVAFLAAVESVRSDRAFILASFTHIPRATNAFARQVLTQGPIVAVAALAAVGAMEASRTWICTHCTRPSLGAEAASSDRVTSASVLAVALVGTLVSVSSSWTQLVAQRSCVPRSASAGP